MSGRLSALKAMQRGSLPGVLEGSQIYGIPINSMNTDELLIACGWLMSQLARLNPEMVGKQETKQ